MIGSNGLWNNVGLDVLHHEIKGVNSFRSSAKKGVDAVGK